MSAWRRWAAVALLSFSVAACATPPFPAPDAGTQVTPRQAVEIGLPVHPQVWGGVIVGVVNRPDHTMLEVVGYPLRNQEPRTDRMTQGRFRLQVAGFLDPLDYRVGRRISAYGPIQRTEPGRIGEVEYIFPVMASTAVKLWPEPELRDRRSGGVTFGIGIGIGL
ncbi:Slp family lipoprotein [Thioalkalivibrio paradoxus]|uniref:Membrane protein n=1 Tax=Thioalkalivibrio paradoxus ARh 1 TaxID=713585 RepID=W0DQQ1_9GAMM|nr:Slp family lipoprotein [Thioalkalivibrio paradoxus]AHE99587.1 membrane protein [Thioalkalivibrio paradoxus ARh 1]